MNAMQGRLPAAVLRSLTLLLVVAATALLRLALDPVLHDQVVYLFLFPAVIAYAALYGPIWGGAVALLGHVTMDYLFIAPRHQIDVGVSSVVVLGTLLLNAWIVGHFARRLRASEERFELAARATNDAIWDWDLRSDALQWNAAVRELFALREGEPGPSSDWWRDHIHPNDRDRVVQSIHAVIDGDGSHWQAEYRFRRGDGSYADVFDRGYVSRDAAGRARRMIGAMLDMSECKRQEAALHASEAAARAAAVAADAERRLLDAVLDAMPLSLFIVDRDGGIVRVNPVAMDFWGDMPETTRWQEYDRWVGYWPDSGRRIEAQEWAMARALLHGEVVRGELVRVQRFNSSEPHCLLNNAAPVRDAGGRIIGAVAVAQDVTEQLRDQARLRESEARLRLFITHAPAAIAMLDRELRYLQVSERWRHGSPLTQAHEGEHFLASLSDIPAHWHDALRRALAGEAQSGDEEPFERSDGSTLYIKWELHPWRDADGAIGGLLIAAEDVTARVQARRALEAAQAQLQNRALQLETLVAERTAKLSEALDELTRLSYSIVHDMRAPVRAMQGYSRMIAEAHGTQLDAEATAYLQRIIAAARRLDELIQGLLNYSRYANADLPLQPVDPEPLLREIIDGDPDMQPPRADIDIVAPLPRVQGHPTALRQVLCNLLDNAVKFVVPGTRAQVRVHAEPCAAGVRLCVQDRGIGLPESAHERIFRIFERLHRDDEYPGTGIGLAIVRRAVERMGGRVGVEPAAEGRGCCFWIELAGAAS